MTKPSIVAVFVYLLISHVSLGYLVHLSLSLSEYPPGENPVATYFVRQKSFGCCVPALLACFASFEGVITPTVCFLWAEAEWEKIIVQYFCVWLIQAHIVNQLMN